MTRTGRLVPAVFFRSIRVFIAFFLVTRSAMSRVFTRPSRRAFSFPAWSLLAMPFRVET